MRWLEVSTPKHRFVAQVDGVQFHAYRTTVPGVDPLGTPVDIALMHGVPTPVKLGERQKTQAEQASVAQKNRMGNLRVEVLDAVAAACALGNPLNRQALKSRIKVKHEDTLAMLDVLLHERWIAEIEIPKEHRTHPNSKSCLVSVSEAQRRIWLETGIRPNFKTYPTPQGSSVPMNVAQEPEAQANDVCM